MEDNAKAAILKDSLIFSSLSDDELSELTRLTFERSYNTGKYIFWEGDTPEWFYIIAFGRIKVIKHISSGKEFIVAFFEDGEMFGEVAVFENKPYPASAQAVTELKVLGIKKADFVIFLSDRPQVALRIINVLGGRLREAQSRLSDFAGERVEQRIARILLMLYSKIGSELPFTKQEIADMAGTTTETTIRVISRLRLAGIIRSGRGKMVILDERRLSLLSDGPPLDYIDSGKPKKKLTI
ncbi:Crp/Fnr family transcriptional regulator [Chloroflexota bacterium]